MSRELNRASHANYGSTSYDPQVGFSGDSRELQTLCDNISTNVYTINSSTRKLQNVLTTLGTARDTQGVRDEVHVWQLSTNQLVTATTTDATRLARLARGANKAQRLQADKITNHFQEAAQSYGKIQLTVAEKLRNSLPQLLTTSTEHEEASLLEDEERQQLQLQQQLQFDTEMAVEREKRIVEIESTILDVNQLMRELSAVVHQQGEQVDTIESHIETARGHVEEGATELRAAAAYQNKSRRRNICLLISLVIGLSILIGIIVWSSR